MMLSARLAIFALVLLVCASSSAWSFPDRYDDEIRQAAKRYMPGYDWRLWKAQLYQESRLDPAAVSPVGAAGLAQFMPGTWAEVSRQLGYRHVSPHLAGPAIQAGAYYQGRQISIWRSPRPAEDRYKLGAASYNAGAGSIIKAQKACNNHLLYNEIIRCLPEITGRHSSETITYVDRIFGYWVKMVLRGRDA